jgi:hypothetical protein
MEGGTDRFFSPILTEKASLHCVSLTIIYKQKIPAYQTLMLLVLLVSYYYLQQPCILKLLHVIWLMELGVL